MCRVTKLSPAQAQRLDEALTATAWVLDLVPQLRSDLPRAMHPVLADLKESADAVHGYIAKSHAKPATR